MSVLGQMTDEHDRAAGLIARESGFKEGGPIRVFPFGYVAHDEAADPAAPLDTAITVGGMGGHFELNVYIPLMARNLLQSIGLLASASRLLAEKCVDGIEANREQCESYAELTLSAATALNPFIGYDKASEIVKTAAASGRSLRDVAREAGVEESVLDEALDYHAMAKPHG